MDKSLFQPLSGFRDLTSPTKRWVLERVEKVFQQFGYQTLETPTLERQAILLDKLGDEGQKQLYLFKDNGDREVGLRYDLTVPLARFVAGNLGSLTLPYKRSEIGPVWRAERAQKGRFRQFTQADIDIIGTDAIQAEVEIVSVIKAVKDELKLPNLLIKINNRALVTELFDKLGIPTDQRSKILIALDKKDKISSAELMAEISATRIDKTQIAAITAMFINADRGGLNQIKSELPGSGSLENIERLIKSAQELGQELYFDLAMVRGLEYYTGTIIECVVEGYNGGSVIAGGRYDNLIENLTGQKVPAVGISFGIDRLAEAVELTHGEVTIPPLFIVNLPETEQATWQWANQLRLQGLNMELYLDSTVELGKQIKYADKRGFKWIIIPLADLWAKGEVAVKDLASGEQTVVKREEIDNG